MQLTRSIFSDPPENAVRRGRTPDPSRPTNFFAETSDLPTRFSRTKINSMIPHTSQTTREPILWRRRFVKQARRKFFRRAFSAGLRKNNFERRKNCRAAAIFSREICRKKSDKRLPHTAYSAKTNNRLAAPRHGQPGSFHG